MQTFAMTLAGAPALSGHWQAVINPATGQAFAQVALGSPAHVDQAVAAARAAFPGWSALPDGERQRLLHALADLLDTHADTLMHLLTLESGKPLAGLGQVGSGMEVGGAVAWTRYTASQEIAHERIQDDADARVEVRRKPLGVVGSITPWNWPLMIAIWHIMPALRAGNTVVIKPAPTTPVATLHFVALASQLLPAGVLNCVTGDGEVGAAMARHPDIDKLVFTGSTPTGRLIMRDAANRLKRLTLELGGNDAGIVLADADPRRHAPALFAAAFHNNGQTCACLKRLLLPDALYEAFCAEFVRLAEQVVVGDGLDPASELGPLQNPAQRALVAALVDDARQQGARVLTGGHALARDGYFYAPTVIADARPGMRVVDEEQFGPVLPLIRYHSLDEAVALANAGDFGLGGSVWSDHPEHAAEIASQLACGTAWVNAHGAVQPDAPFGGVKQSGLGVAFGAQGLEAYSSLQTLKVMKH